MKSGIQSLIMLLAFSSIGTGCFGDSDILDVSNSSRIHFSIDIPSHNHPRKVNIKEFGAKGDGKTDDTDAVNRAIKSVKDGTTIIFDPGVYLISRSLLISRGNISLKGNKAVLFYKHISGSGESLLMIKNGSRGTYTSSFPAIMIKGSLETQAFKVSKIEENNSILLESAGHKLEAGDTVIISSPDSGKRMSLTTKSGKTKALSFYREQNFITSLKQVSKKKLILNDPLTIAFQNNTINVNRIIPVKDVQVSGFEIVFDKALSKNYDTSGVQLYCTANVTISQCKINFISRSAVSMLHAYKTVITGNSLKEAVRFDGSRGLGIELNRSHFCSIKNNTISTFRHGIILNHGNGNNLIEKNTVTLSTATGAIDLHGEFNYFNTIRYNKISSSKTAIVVGGGGSAHYNDGPYNCIAFNSITGCEYGIELRNNSGPVILEDNKFNEIRYKKLRLTNFDDELINDED